jgi:hypothetical protein
MHIQTGIRYRRRTQDSSVSTVNMLQAGQENMGYVPDRGTDSLLNSTPISPWAQPASYPVGSGGALSLGAKWLGFESNNSHPDSATVKNVWRDTAIPSYLFMV